MGIVFVSFPATAAAAGTEARINIYPAVNKLLGTRLKQLILLVHKGVKVDDVATLGIAKFTHSFRERAEHDLFLCKIGCVPKDSTFQTRGC